MSAPTKAGETQALAERVVARMLEHDEFSRWLGVEVVEIAPDRCVARMTVRREMVNGFGVCHGGVTFSLADSALAFAANTNGNVTVSIANAIRYPAAVRPGDVLVATCEREGGSNRLAYYRVRVERDSTLVATFDGTVYRTEKPHFPGGT